MKRKMIGIVVALALCAGLAVTVSAAGKTMTYDSAHSGYAPYPLAVKFTVTGVAEQKDAESYTTRYDGGSVSISDHIIYVENDSAVTLLGVWARNSVIIEHYLKMGLDMDAIGEFLIEEGDGDGALDELYLPGRIYGLADPEKNMWEQIGEYWFSGERPGGALWNNFVSETNGWSDNAKWGILLGRYLICPASAFAQPATGTKIPAADNVKVIIDGKAMSFEVPPQIINGRTMVPLRAIFEEMGAAVNYDSGTRTVTAKKGDTVVVMTIGSTSPTVNGKVVAIDQPGVIVDGRTLAPLRFVAEAFGGAVKWDAAAKTATIAKAK